MISCSKVDLSNPALAQTVLDLLEAYSLDIMGGGEQLSDYVKENLITELMKRPTAHVFLARLDDKPAGLAITFEGFSTFACKPLLNIHDMCVLAPFRRQGICSSLMFYIDQFARSIGCCKITLEVLEGNHAAKAAYVGAGFAPYELDPDAGQALFW